MVKFSPGCSCLCGCPDPTAEISINCYPSPHDGTWSVNWSVHSGSESVFISQVLINGVSQSVPPGQVSVSGTTTFPRGSGLSEVVVVATNECGNSATASVPVTCCVDAQSHYFEYQGFPPVLEQWIYCEDTSNPYDRKYHEKYDKYSGLDALNGTYVLPLGVADDASALQAVSRNNKRPYDFYAPTIPDDTCMCKYGLPDLPFYNDACGSKQPENYWFFHAYDTGVIITKESHDRFWSLDNHGNRFDIRARYAKKVGRVYLAEMGDFFIDWTHHQHGILYTDNFSFFNCLYSVQDAPATKHDGPLQMCMTPLVPIYETTYYHDHIPFFYWFAAANWKETSSECKDTMRCGSIPPDACIKMRLVDEETNNYSLEPAHSTPTGNVFVPDSGPSNQDVCCECPFDPYDYPIDECELDHYFLNAHEKCVYAQFPAPSCLNYGSSPPYGSLNIGMKFWAM